MRTFPKSILLGCLIEEGNTHWIEIRTVLFTWEGKPATLDFLTDITERKQAAEALRESEQRYRLLIEQSMDAIYLFDPSTMRVLEGNPAFAKLLGYTDQEVPGLSLYDFGAHEREDTNRNIKQLLKTGSLEVTERK